MYGENFDRERLDRAASDEAGERTQGTRREFSPSPSSSLAVNSSILRLWLGFFGGSWATMQWLSRSVQDRIETRSMVDLQITGGREMLAEIEEAT